jgi:ribonuclease Z
VTYESPRFRFHSERVRTFGYVVVEPDRPGKLDGERAKQLGVSGPELGRLKKGQDVVLADGRVIKSSDVVSPDIPGRTVALVQDTFDGSSMLKACQHADIVIHEATFDNSMRERAVQKGHSTAEMAAQFAVAAKATLLVLTHFSARYCDDASPLEQEAKAVHENTIAAEDFMELKWVKSVLNVSHAKRLDAQ